LTLEADGTVTPAAVEAFNRALALQPSDARALYYLGLHEAQAGDSAAAASFSLRAPLVRSRAISASWSR